MAGCPSSVLAVYGPIRKFRGARDVVYRYIGHLGFETFNNSRLLDEVYDNRVTEINALYISFSKL